MKMCKQSKIIIFIKICQYKQKYTLDLIDVKHFDLRILIIY